MAKISKQEIRALVTEEMVQTANAYLVAKAYAETIRSIVVPYQVAILSKYQWTDAESKAKMKAGLLAEGKTISPRLEGPNELILDPKQSFRLSEAAWEIYSRECEAARIENKLHVTKEGNCPLLEADELQRQANRLFVDTMKPITKIDSDTILCSAKGLNGYRQLTEAALGLLGTMGLLKNEYTLAGDDDIEKKYKRGVSQSL